MRSIVFGADRGLARLTLNLLESRIWDQFELVVPKMPVFMSSRTMARRVTFRWSSLVSPDWPNFVGAGAAFRRVRDSPAHELE